MRLERGRDLAGPIVLRIHHSAMAEFVRPTPRRRTDSENNSANVVVNARSVGFARSVVAKGDERIDDRGPSGREVTGQNGNGE